MTGLKNKRNTGRPRLAIPVWGIFGMLLVVFLGAAGYGGWKTWDRRYRQPRLSAMFNHHREWQSWRSAEEDDAASILKLEKIIAKAKNVLRPKVKHSRAALDYLDRNCESWEAELIKAREQCLKDRENQLALEKESRAEFGVPVTELGSAVENLLHSIADDPEAIVRFRLIVEEDLRLRPRPILQYGLPLHTPIDLPSWETVLSVVEAVQRSEEVEQRLTEMGRRIEEQKKRALQELESEDK